MLSKKTRIIRALIGLAIMIAKAVVWQLVGTGRTSALYRGRHGILPRLLLFKPLLAEALNLAAVCGLLRAWARSAINLAAKRASNFKFSMPCRGTLNLNERFKA
nr:hypothetical protein [uncultured Campylobacter sp.]